MLHTRIYRCDRTDYIDAIEKSDQKEEQIRKTIIEKLVRYKYVPSGVDYYGSTFSHGSVFQGPILSSTANTANLLFQPKQRHIFGINDDSRMGNYNKEVFETASISTPYPKKTTSIKDSGTNLDYSSNSDSTQDSRNSEQPSSIIADSIVEGIIKDKIYGPRE